MKKVQSQLSTVAKTLASLAEKVEKLSAQIAAPAPKKATKAAPKKKKAPAKKAAVKKAPAKKAPAAAKDTVLDSVLDVIKKSRTGATIANLKAKTNLESRQLSNALYKLSKKGKIKSKARGVYIKA
jgi:predicted Rossmann fold nucleotide-binding protein DprA/Smf involved in DNA uptake